MPQDDLTGVNELIASTHSAILRRPATVIGDPVIRGDRSLLDQVAERPEVHAAFADATWRVEWVDLTRVLSVQKMITTDGLDLRIADATADPAALAELCLPAEQPTPPQGAFAQSGRPRFRAQLVEPEPARGRQQRSGSAGIGFPSGATAESAGIHVLRQHGRQLRPSGPVPGPVLPPRRLPPRGRAAPRRRHPGASDRHRRPIIPVHKPHARSFDHEVAFSDRAPGLADFWDDSVSANALQPAVRKVVHLRAEEFVIQG